MRIGMHLEALRSERIGGLETYVRQLVSLLPRLSQEIELVLFCADHNASTFTPGPGLEIHTLDHAAFASLDSAHLHSAQLDLWFCPLLVLEPHEPGLPTVVTIPDMQHEAFPEFFAQSVLDWRRLNYFRSAHRSDAILTFSRFSREHIVDTLQVSRDKVHAIHLDAAPVFTVAPTLDAGYLREVKSRYGLPEIFLYYPANNWPHKNHSLLFQARRLAEAELGRRLPLVLTGAEVDGSDPWEQVIDPRDRVDNGVRYLGYVPEEDLPGLYALSRALIFPSLYEGFGMPVLEAMRAGCPVVCSAVPSLREISDDAALYFDPAQPDELSARLVDIASNDRRDLVEAGLTRAENFSWDCTARATLAVFRSLVSQRDTEITVTDSSDQQLPLISIVTPSLQQGRFIEETLRSVLEQNYPRLEYWVMDGGSTDGTLDVLERYQRRYSDVLHYVSEPDGGQAAALNKGLERVRGDIIGWLNSDDTYEPGTLMAVARTFRDHPTSDLVYGRAHYVSETGDVIGEYPTQPAFRWYALIHQCYLCQPTVFMRRAVVDDGQRLDETLQLCLDYDLWIRLGKRFRFSFIDRHLANSRIYQENKTLSQQGAVLQEVLDVIKRHFGWVPLSWATAWAHFHRERGDAFINIKPVSKRTFLEAVWFMVRHNWSVPQHWHQATRDVAYALACSWRRRWHAVWPSPRRTLAVPRGALIVNLGVESTRQEAAGSTRVAITCNGRHLGELTVNGPGRHTRRIGVPRRPGGLSPRLVIASDLLRGGALHSLPLEPFPAVAEDGWLEREDTLRLPGSWEEAQIAFMLPVAPAEGVRLTFRHRGQVIDEWTLDRAGDHSRRLRLPPDRPTTSDIIDIDFSASASLPPEPARGEMRPLAIRVLEIAEPAPEGAVE